MEKIQVKLLLIGKDAVCNAKIQNFFREEYSSSIVQTVDSGEHALSLLADEKFDVILWDFDASEIPEFDRFIQQRQFPPAIVMIDSGQEELAVRAVEKGAFGFAVKDAQNAYLLMLPAIIHSGICKNIDAYSLNVSEVKFRTLFEFAGDGIIIIKDGLLVECNQKVEKIYRTSRENLIGQDVLLLARCQEPNGTESVAKSAELIQSALNGEPQMFEWLLTAADGKQIEVEVLLTRIEIGDSPSVMGIIRDISFRKRTERALQETTDTFQLLVDQSKDGIVMTDHRGYVIEWNHAQEEITGLHLDQALGRLIWDVQFDLATPEKKNPELLARVKSFIQNFYETKKAGWMNKPVEVELMRPDGRRIIVETVTFPIHTQERFWVGTITRDVTQSKMAKNALEASERRIRTLYETVGSVIMLLDDGFRILEWNLEAERIFGFTKDEVVGKEYVSEFVPEANRREFRQSLEKMSGGDSVRNMENPIIDRSGTIHTMLWNVSKFIDSNGNLTTILAIGHDISDRKLREAEREKLLAELTDAMENIKTLKGLVPICANCKKIRDDKGFWNSLESYISEHTEAQFSHGICPECMKKLYPDYYRESEGENDANK